MLVVDFHSWVYFGDYTWNGKCWPAPKEVAATLAARGTSLLLSTYVITYHGFAPRDPRAASL